MYGTWNESAETDPNLTAYISGSIEEKDVKVWQNIESSLRNVLSKFEIDIFDSLEIMRFPKS